MKKIFLAAIAICFSALTSCEDWTTPENLEYDADPVLRDDATYLNNLRAYKSDEDDHNLAMAYFNSSSKLLSQTDRISSMPDSLDIIVVKNITDVYPGFEKDLDYVRGKLGTKVYAMVEFDPISSVWQDMIPVGETDDRTSEEVAEYFLRETNKQLACFDSYGYDGMVVSLLAQNNSVVGFGDFFGAIDDWLSDRKHPERMSATPIMFRGSHWLVSSNSLLPLVCRYVIVNSSAVAGGNQVQANTNIDTAIKNHYDNDSSFYGMDVIYETAFKDVGAMASGNVQLSHVALWLNAAPTPDGEAFVKRGFAIDNTAVDYYYDMDPVAGTDLMHSSTDIYMRIRKAIGVISNKG